MANNTSQHILNTSTNLLGFCLFVITSLHISNKTETSLIDEAAAIVGVLLVFSSLFSFVSIRSKETKNKANYENLADYLFFGALIGVLLIIVFISFKLV